MNENQIQTLLQALRTLQDLGKVAYFNKGTYNSETTYEINDVVSYNGSSYVSLGNDNLGNLPTNTAFWSIVASKGDKGDTGKAFVIEKTYESIEDMVADYDNMNVNDYVMIQGSVEAQENATLWTKTDTEVSPYKWVYLADFSGASGITGATPNIQIGTVTEGNEPSVTRRAGSTNENPILDFVLKTGAKGDTGATGNGISGIEKTSTSGLTDTYTISYTNGNSSTFDVHNGKGISNIAKTSSVGLVDTYTITYNDGTTSTFEITNGKDGEVTQEQLDETNEEVERVNMVYNALPKVSGEETDLTLDNTAECPVYDIKLSPSELEQASTTGKNLFNDNFNDYTRPQDYRIYPITLEQGQEYTLKATLKGTQMTGIIVAIVPYGDKYSEFPSSLLTCINSAGGVNTRLITPDDTWTSPKLVVYCSDEATFNSIFENYEVQLEKGTTATEYEEYTGGQPSPSPDYPQDIHVVSGENTITISNSDNTKSQTYPISLGNLEYCKIGDYEDLFFKNVVGSEYYDSTLELDKWYLKKKIYKKILDGTEVNLTLQSINAYGIANFKWTHYLKTFNSQVLCDKLLKQTTPISQTTTEGIFWQIDDTYIRLDEDRVSTLEDFRTWLSTNNLTTYSVLQTSTYTLLNDTLQTQLDNLSNAISYSQQTNVSQTNNDLPFVIKLSAIRDMSGIFDLISQSEEI